ncbi:unnamed protein product [Closterium sp. Yama58-4]|nr:unnamed protein product [Closterium sp. Yama58-4]
MQLRPSRSSQEQSSRSNPHPPSQPPPRLLTTQPPPWPAYEPAAIHKLPRDVIAKIFSHLSVADRCSVSLVCRLWFRYERLLPHYMQSEVSATEIRFVLRRFPLIRTLRVRCLGPTVLPGAPREERAEDRHHKRPADEFWKCVEGHSMLSKVTVYKCTHLTDRFLRHVARCGALKEISIASCPNVSGGGFAELAEKCPGLEEMVLEDLSLSVVAKKARSAPGGGRAGGGGAGEGAGRGEGEGAVRGAGEWRGEGREEGGGEAEGRVGLDGRAAEGGAERTPGGEGERGGGVAGEDVRMGEGEGEAERGVGGMEGGEGREWERAHGGAGQADEGDWWRGAADGAVRAGEAEAAEAQVGAEGRAAAGRGGSLVASFPNLSSLKLINCTLDAHWLEMFAGQLPALRKLTVMACPDPLDQFFVTAARTAARLESVEIVDCEGVSDRGIVALLNGCPAINSLTLSGGGAWSGVAIAAAQMEPRLLWPPARKRCAGCTTVVYHL